MKTKKILIFSLVYYPHYVGGAEMAVKEITDRVSVSEVEFHVITLRRSSLDLKHDKVGNTIVHRIGYPIFREDIVRNHKVILFVNKLLYPVLAFFKALSLYRFQKIDSILSLMANYSGFSAYFFKIIYPNIPFVLYLQEGDSEKHLRYRWGGLINLSWKLTLKKADYLVAISTYLLNRTKEFGFRGLSYVIPNGVDVSYFNKDIPSPEIDDIRKKLDFSKNDILLVTSSRLNIKNGIGDVIKALTNLPENIKFIILGTGELEQDLKNLAQKLGVNNRVAFIGFVDHEMLHKYLKASDIFIRPSLSEGFGSSFIEAMASRIPVIATPVGGIPDFLIAGKTGYFCKPNDPQSIVDSVKFVVGDHNKSEVVERAFQMVNEKYDWNYVAKEMNEKIFSQI